MEMIFIDNDDEQQAKKDYKTCLDMLRWANVDTSIFDPVEVISDFAHVEVDDRYKIIMEADVILTHSMFTSTHFGSKYQLRRMLAGIARYKPEGGLIYIDTGSYLREALDDAIRDGSMQSDHSYTIQCGIQNNHIITVDDYDNEEGVWQSQPRLLKVAFNAYGSLKNRAVYGQEINLNELLNNKQNGLNSV